MQRERLDALPVTTADGTSIRLGEVTRARFDLGPSMVRRENVERIAMLTANVSGADLAGTVEEAQRRLDRGLSLPAGYRISYGGQFEQAASSVRNLAVLSAGNPGRFSRWMRLSEADHAVIPEWPEGRPSHYRPLEFFRYFSRSESVERMSVASRSSAVCSVSMDFQNS